LLRSHSVLREKVVFLTRKQERTAWGKKAARLEKLTGIGNYPIKTVEPQLGQRGGSSLKDGRTRAKREGAVQNLRGARPDTWGEGGGVSQKARVFYHKKELGKAKETRLDGDERKGFCLYSEKPEKGRVSNAGEGTGGRVWEGTTAGNCSSQRNDTTWPRVPGAKKDAPSIETQMNTQPGSIGVLHFPWKGKGGDLQLLHREKLKAGALGRTNIAIGT